VIHRVLALFAGRTHKRAAWRMNSEPQSSQPSLSWRLLFRLWKFVRPHRLMLALFCVCFLINQATTVVLPVALGKVLDQILPAGDLTALNTMVAFLLGFLLFKSILTYIERELSVLLGAFIVRDVRIQLHAHFLRMSLRFLDDYQVGRVVSRIMGDTECVKNLLISATLNASASAVRFLFILGTLIYLDWKLTLVSCAVLPFFLLGFWRFANGSKAAYCELNEDQGNLVSSVNETFNGVRVVKTYCGERRANASMLGRMHDIMRKSLYVSHTQHLLTVVWEGTAWLSLIALIWYGGNRVIDHNLSVGQIVAFYGLLGQLQGPIADLININAALQPALVSIHEIERVLDTPPEIVDRPTARHAGDLKGDIEFANVEFTYKTARKSETNDPMRALIEAQRPRMHTLTNISFHIKAGECVAVVGASGSGKSTLLNLLGRLYDADAGSIRVDGVDIRDYRLTSYLKNFGIVLQENFLFRGTIRDNIRYSRLNASDAEIVDAAKRAGAWEFIEELPDGLDTWCTERGLSLSGGQKQRLSIARAILANPRLLILDEATSALDSHTEAQVQRALDELMRGRTTFIVAHRLSTIVGANKIIVLDRGQIIECGSHAELLSRNGRYAEMFNEQFGKVQEHFKASTHTVDTMQPLPFTMPIDAGTSGRNSGLRRAGASQRAEVKSSPAPEV
jgi:subfamily B ATP-binding cassette protein MsbA